MNPSRAAYVLLAVLAFAGLDGCLLGSDSASNPLSRADRLYRQGRYPEALSAYEQAIAKDSTLSLAYAGYVNSTLRVYGVEDSVLWRELSSPPTDSLPFGPLMGHSDSILTLRLQALLRINRVLDRFVRRDTLSLTDGKWPLDSMGIRFVTYKFAYWVMHVHDLDGNDTLNAHDAILRNMIGTPPQDTGIGLDSSLNQKILDLKNGFADPDLNELLHLFYPDSVIGNP